MRRQPVQAAPPLSGVARISLPHVLQDGCIYNRDAAFPQLFLAPFGPCFDRCGDEQLGVGIGADDRADIAAVEDGAARVAGRKRRNRAGTPAALPAPPGRRRPGRRPGATSSARSAGSARTRARFPGAAARRPRPPGGIERSPPARSDGEADGAIERAGVEMGETSAVGQPARQRTLAASGRSVDGDDHAGPCVGHGSSSGLLAYHARRPSGGGSGDAGAEAVHQRHETGEAGVDGARVVHRDRLASRPARAPGSSWRCGGPAGVATAAPPPAARRRAVDDQAVGAVLDADAAGVQAVGDHARAGRSP